MKTLRSLTSILVCLAILFAFFLSMIKVFGFEIYGVLTGSMNPAIPSGSMIYIRDAEPERLRIGDVITYSVSPGMMATHRIVDIVEDETNPTLFRFQTKGDANPAVDAVLVEPKKIVGKVAFSIPFLGSVAHYIQKPPGIFVAIGISLVLVALVLLTDTATAEKLVRQKGKQLATPEREPTNHRSTEEEQLLSLRSTTPTVGATMVQAACAGRETQPAFAGMTQKPMQGVAQRTMTMQQGWSPVPSGMGNGQLWQQAVPTNCTVPPQRPCSQYQPAFVPPTLPSGYGVPPNRNQRGMNPAPAQVWQPTPGYSNQMQYPSVSPAMTPVHADAQAIPTGNPNRRRRQNHSFNDEWKGV